jgi:hypothetical protein
MHPAMPGGREHMRMVLAAVYGDSRTGAAIPMSSQEKRLPTVSAVALPQSLHHTCKMSVSLQHNQFRGNLALLKRR